MRDDRQTLILRATQGDAEAAAFLAMMVEVLHFWDDLVDRDHPIADDEINARMWQALVLLPRNRFYRDNFDELNPILAVAIQNWLCANRLEHGVMATHQDVSDVLPIAFIIRSSYVDLFTQTALLIGGFAHAQEVTEEVRRMTHGETYNGYLHNLHQQYVDAELRLKGDAHVL